MANAVTLVIDGGGTSTGVAVVRSGKIIARTDLSSYKPEPFNSKTNELCRALGSWMATAAEEPLSPEFVVVGMSGIWDDDEKDSYVNDLTDAWMTYIETDVPSVMVISDVELVQVAALKDNAGIVLIAGTGSIAVGVTEEGERFRVGGWGPRVGDEGGGFWIGREALQAVARMLDGRGGHTKLIRPVAALLRSNPDDLNDLRGKLRKAKLGRCASLAQSVLTYAEEGDTVAKQIRAVAVDELSYLVDTLTSDLDEVPSVVCFGSLLKNTGFREELFRSLHRVVPEAELSVMDDLLESMANTLRE